MSRRKDIYREYGFASRGACNGRCIASVISSLRNKRMPDIVREAWQKDIRPAASMTIEAAVVVPISLIAIVAVTIAGFKLHDIVIGNMTANEAAELYNHLPEDMKEDTYIESYGESRLEAVLSGMGYSLDIEDYRDGSRVHLSTADGERVYEDAGSRPEKLMRKLTLIDAFNNPAASEE